MIVIPPSRLQEDYFKGLADVTWEQSLEKQKDLCEALKSENRTLKITCKINVEDGMESLFHLHFRYYHTKLYCFIEEDEPIKKEEKE
jgi:hypothetical protein